MSTLLGALLTLAAFVGVLVLAILRALALDEVRGRIARRAERSVEETLASMSVEQQAEWADEWRAELASVRSMPISALRFARGVRASAAEMVGAQALAGAAGRSARTTRTISLTRGTDRVRSVAGRLRTLRESIDWELLQRFLRLLAAMAFAAGGIWLHWSSPWILASVLSLSLAAAIYEILRRN